ncbi:hypothetical protein NKI36_14310 [Mesorhizobium caraganae]|uniref:Uncharacterized protein n=1 Tax=Mesorhizobium caraganae TaxID=483206 RepID=A0ABV1Z070_9HYPH
MSAIRIGLAFGPLLSLFALAGAIDTSVGEPYSRQVRFTCIPIGAPVPQKSVRGLVSNLERRPRKDGCLETTIERPIPDQLLSVGGSAGLENLWLSSDTRIFALKNAAMDQLQRGASVAVISRFRPESSSATLLVILLPDWARAQSEQSWNGQRDTHVFSGTIAGLGTPDNRALKLSYKDVNHKQKSKAFPVTSGTSIAIMSIGDFKVLSPNTPVFIFASKDICDCAWEADKVFVGVDGLVLPF